MAIEGWQAQEALYMTVITITAVGYSEVYPLSELGRNFTMVLLAAGITGIGVWFALITSFIVARDLNPQLTIVARALEEGSMLRDARIPQETGLIVIAVRKQKDETHRFVFNPVADTRLEIGDEMIVLGKHDQVVQLRAYAGT
jgi:uncharacterized transporter YbjL